MGTAAFNIDPDTPIHALLMVSAYLKLFAYHERLPIMSFQQRYQPELVSGDES